MNSYPELATMLRTLRLSGMLDSLEVRNRQALQEHMAPIDFLTLLLSDEIARREQQRLTARLRRAAFHSAKTIEQFDFGRTPGVNRATVNDLLTCRFIGEAAPVHIVGPVGTGKSHLAQAIGHQAVRLGHDVFFATQSQLFGSLTRARLSGVHERRMKMLAKVAPHDDDLHEIVAARYEKLPTVITSNLASEEWQEAFSNNKMLGLATVDRLMHGAYCVALEGRSHRSPRVGNDAETIHPAAPDISTKSAAGKRQKQ
ncbi:MAG: ATP-binding protein [Betaproteobacteria bacterium]|nr:ATP-binding protein [Betaproteobacteria bacterium]